MFFMALRSVLARRRLCRRAEGHGHGGGTVQSHGCRCAYVLYYRRGAIGCTTRSLRRQKLCGGGDTVTLYYDPENPEKMYVERATGHAGSRGAVAVLGVACWKLTVGIAR